jgi:carboxyl-terminal processing protease
MNTEQAANLLQGHEGSEVALEILGQNGAIRNGKFLRRRVNVRSIPVAKIIDRTHGIGYIQLTVFQKTSTDELDVALSQLRREGLRSLILDLRDNPGGLVDIAVEILDRFVAEGVLVSTRGRAPDQTQSYVARGPGTWDMPLVLLTDGMSASASEIVAGAIRDHRRGTIVGRKTYGKWSVQTTIPIDHAAGLRITTAKFYSPHGHNYSGVGVRPDHLVPEPSKQRGRSQTSRTANFDEDQDVQKGLDVLRTQMARSELR